MKEEEKIIAKKVELPKTKTNILPIVMAAAIGLLAISTAYFAWSYAKKADDNKLLQTQISDLSDDIDDLKNDLARAKKSTKATPTPTATPVITEDLVETIDDSITTMNTAALQGYMASSIMVVMAATEFGESRTPTQAISDLNYLSSATAPWDFDLPSTTLDGFKAGFYSQYFGDNTVVGQSSDGYVVSFGINDDGEIDAIFMAVSADLLI